jgi:hypothetical protein
VARTSSSPKRGGDDGLVDTAVTVVFGGALLLSAAYMLASFATGGAAGALAARPFALPAATLLLLAKFVTNSALLLVEAVCAALYQIPSGLAVPVSLALMFFRMRAARAARQEASSRFARDNPEVVAQARGRLATSADLDGPDDDIDTMANSGSGGTRRRSGARQVAAPSAPSTVIVRAERPAAVAAELPTARALAPPASAAPSPAGARAAAVAAAAATDSVARQAQMQARNAEARAAAIAKAKAELRAKAAAVAAAAAAVSLDALPVSAAPAAPAPPVQLAGKPSSTGSTASSAPSAPAPASAPPKAASGPPAVAARDVVPPPFFRSASTPAAAAAAEAAARVMAKGLAEDEDDAASGTVKVKAGAQTLQKVKPAAPRSLKDLSLLELGALAAQMVAKDALDNVAKSGTISLSRDGRTTKA